MLFNTFFTQSFLNFPVNYWSINVLNNNIGSNILTLKIHII
jgi:hypothetical protein